MSVIERPEFTIPNPVTAKIRPTISAISSELQALQRMRSVAMKSRIMNANRLQAIVAGTMGFDSAMPEKERLKMFAKAAEVIKKVDAGELETPQDVLIKTSMIGINAFEDWKEKLEKQMKPLAKSLPVSSWVAAPEQRGFGLMFLAIVVGETGDLGNYANPGKLWRRLGCAPWTHDGKTAMGATWKSGREGKLPASEWEAFGYSPRRRSIAFLIGEGIVKQNGSIAAVGDDDTPCETEGKIVGPYRLRYDQTKAAIKAKHPDYSDLRCHRHGMLLATKLLLKNLWIEWNC